MAAFAGIYMDSIMYVKSIDIKDISSKRIRNDARDHTSC